MRLSARLTWLLTACLSSHLALASDTPPPAAPPPVKAEQKELVPDAVTAQAVVTHGWKPRVSLGASISFSDNRKVVGAQDGSTWNIGPQIDLGIDYYGVEHEWRNSLAIRHVQTKTPALSEFVKTVDSVVFDSIYLYHSPALPWIGPFAQFSLMTQLLAGEDVRAQDTNYKVAFQDGTIRDSVARRLKLTDAFAPLILRESVGAFIAPVTKPEIKVEFRVGVGAREAFVQEGFALTDDAATTDVVEVSQLENFVQIGGEIFGGISGTIVWENLGADRPLTYSLTAETLMPFYSSEGDEKDFADKITFALDGKLGVKLFSWMSLDYNLKIIREPLLLDEFQIQNNLLLNFSYTYAPQ